MNAAWWRLPGPSRFIEQSAEEFRDGRNLILGLPEHLPQGLEEAVRSTFDPTGVVEWVGLTVDGGPPLQQLFERFASDTPPDMLRNAATLLQQEGFQGRIVWLRGLGPAWSAWREFLAEYGHACQSVSRFVRTLFGVAAIGEAALTLPVDNLCLSVRRWSGVVDPLDAQVYAAGLLRTRRFPAVHKTLATVILAELASWDPAVCERLAEESWEILLRPQLILREVGRERGWEGIAPDGERAWALGWQDDFGGRSTWHAAVLAANPADREIERRIWSAQVRVLLPHVEECRQDLLARLAPLLPVPLRLPDGRVITDLDELEIGQLEYCLSSLDLPVPPDLRLLKRVRNQLAHLEVVGSELLHSEILRLGPLAYGR